MSSKRQSVEHDKSGNPFLDAPRKNSAQKVRVSFVREWYSPPVSETGKVDYERAAAELRQEITGGTLRFSSYFEDGDLGFPAEVKITSRSELDAFFRAVRAVFKDGVRQSNAIREAGLQKCEASLGKAQSGSSRMPRRVEDRRASPERRSADRRGKRTPTLIDLRQSDRRGGGERRSGEERRAA